MTSQKNIKISDFNGVNVAKHWHVWRGEVFAISDCLVCVLCCTVYVSTLVGPHNYVSNDIFGLAVSPGLPKILPIEVYYYF